MDWYWLPVISSMGGGAGSLWGCLCLALPWIMLTDFG